MQYIYRLFHPCRHKLNARISSNINFLRLANFCKFYRILENFTVNKFLKGCVWVCVGRARTTLVRQFGWSFFLEFICTSQRRYRMAPEKIMAKIVDFWWIYERKYFRKDISLCIASIETHMGLMLDNICFPFKIHKGGNNIFLN